MKQCIISYLKIMLFLTLMACVLCAQLNGEKVSIHLQIHLFISRTAAVTLMVALQLHNQAQMYLQL